MESYEQGIKEKRDTERTNKKKGDSQNAEV